MKPRFETWHSAFRTWMLSHHPIWPLPSSFITTFLAFSDIPTHLFNLFFGHATYKSISAWGLVSVCVCSNHDLHNITYFFKANLIALLLHANLSQILHSRGQSGPIHNHWFYVRTSLPHSFSLLVLHTSPQMDAAQVWGFLREY